MEGISPAPGWGVERWSGAESIFGPGAEKGVCTKNTGAVTSLCMEMYKCTYVYFGISEYKEERWTNAGSLKLKNIFLTTSRQSITSIEG